MKKFTSIILIAALMFYMMISVQAASGNAAGNIYKTDIKTYVFGELINSYNIGGKTIIICEDLNWCFGFDVIWNDSSRTLDVNDRYPKYFFTEEPEIIPDISQSIKDLPKDYYTKPVPTKIYSTDIKTYLNGSEIQSYNLGGRTAIVCEDMRDYGFNVVWDEIDRTLSISINRNNFFYEPSDIGTITLTGEISRESMASAGYYESVIFTDEKETKVKSLFLNESSAAYYPLVDMCGILNMSYEWDGKNLALYTSEMPADTSQPYEISRGGIIKQNLSGTIYYFDVRSITIDGYPAELNTDYTDGITEQSMRPIEAYLFGGCVYLPESFFQNIEN